MHITWVLVLNELINWYCRTPTLRTRRCRISSFSNVQLHSFRVVQASFDRTGRLAMLVHVSSTSTCWSPLSGFNAMPFYSSTRQMSLCPFRPHAFQWQQLHSSRCARMCTSSIVTSSAGYLPNCKLEQKVLSLSWVCNCLPSLLTFGIDRLRRSNCFYESWSAALLDYSVDICSNMGIVIVSMLISFKLCSIGLLSAGLSDGQAGSGLLLGYRKLKCLLLKDNDSASESGNL